KIRANINLFFLREKRIDKIMEDSTKRIWIQSLAEFLGTAYFIFFGVGGGLALSNNITDTYPGVGLIAGPIAWGFSLVVNVWIWAPISGGVLNPAITIGLMIIEAEFRYTKGILYIIAQFLGAVLGAYLIEVVQPGPDGGATTLAEGTTILEGLLLETFCTSILTLAVFMLAIEKHAKFRWSKEHETPKRDET
ncbi:26498_t:CDS:2, partial [Racocetra persica]